MKYSVENEAPPEWVNQISQKVQDYERREMVGAKWDSARTFLSVFSGLSLMTSLHTSMDNTWARIVIAGAVLLFFAIYAFMPRNNPVIVVPAYKGV